MVRALVCGTRGRWFESTLLYQTMTKEKKNNPSKELPLGFVDRQEKELLVRDFIVSNIKEIMKSRTSNSFSCLSTKPNGSSLEGLLFFSFVIVWYSRVDSNHRPLVPQTSALTD